MSRSLRRGSAILGSTLVGPACVQAESSGGHADVAPWMVIPFVLLLLSIAILPFVNRHWWERRYPHVAIGFGLVTISYYLFVLNDAERMLHTAHEYVSFIALIGSLFVVAGGLLIRIRGKATPVANIFLLSIGAVISNIVGTTGASMILIKPYLRVNRYRIKPFHVVFFIFIVSNMGGALTPIGDPPLFLGYLRGVPFFWVAETLWAKWAIAILLVLAVFYVMDHRDFHALPPAARHAAEAADEVGEVSGMQNVLFLVVILVAVFVTNPPLLREALMCLAAVGSYLTTKKEIHKKNDFNFIPIKEVAFLFFGIFATMVPALDWLERNAGAIGIRSAGQFYWTTGFLSTFLDNAPTYLNFLSAQIGLLVSDQAVREVQRLVSTHGADLSQVTAAGASEVARTYATLMKYHYDLVASGAVPLDEIHTSFIIGNHDIYLKAISIAAVFFGACSYIGNGPNFMVKSIAEQMGVPCPSFFGYMVKYAIPILIPIFLLIWFFFFRG
jgi:Na+/H+ antiporter NhaD/arsenite permease-like protein